MEITQIINRLSALPSSAWRGSNCGGSLYNVEILDSRYDGDSQRYEDFWTGAPGQQGVGWPTAECSATHKGDLWKVQKTLDARVLRYWCANVPTGEKTFLGFNKKREVRHRALSYSSSVKLTLFVNGSGEKVICESSNGSFSPLDELFRHIYEKILTRADSIDDAAKRLLDGSP
ncbi:MAG: hypothetical protein ACP5NS_02420 [Candidatus Pacearchaeota archaeon]